MPDCQQPFMIFSIFYHLEKPITLKPSNSAAFCFAILPSFSLSPLTLYYNQQKKKKKKLQEGGPFPGPKGWILYNPGKWINWGDRRAYNAKDFTGKGHLGREQQGKGTPNCSAMWFTVSDFIGIELVSELSLANCLAQPIFGLTQGPSWWPVHLSDKVDSSDKDSGRLVISSLWLGPPKFFWFSESTMFFIKAACCETTRTSSYYFAWPWWVVSVNGSPTLYFMFLWIQTFSYS